MMAELIDRRALKAETRDLLRDAQVSPKALAGLYLALLLAMDLVNSFTGDGLPGTFFMILVALMGMVLQAGFVLYCMAVRRGELAEILTLFDGFSFAGKVILLGILQFALIYLWSMLFIVPGIIASYRYRFALYNLCENPDLNPLEAISMSKRQTAGYKVQLLTLDLSYVGWMVLANLPYLVYSAAAYQVIFQEMAAEAGFHLQVASWAPALVWALPAWGWTLVTGVWHLAVGLFYLPAYQCVELGYFETAKSTSGVGHGTPEDRASSPWDRRDGPDGLGGF